MTDKQPGERRPLTNQGGVVEIGVDGDRTLAASLARALEAAGREEPDTLTHGFHAYPARMHPAIARVLITELSDQRARILDPFCGSGTVLVESLVTGRRVAGVDLNPLAIRISETKTSYRGEAARDHFRQTVETVAQRSEDRVRSRTPAMAKLPKHELQWYGPHILKELAGLREEIAAIDNDDVRRPMEVVFSAIVVKCSNQRADTAERQSARSLRKGLPTEWFLAKGRELTQRWASFHEAAQSNGSDVHHPLLLEGDIRRLDKLLSNRAADLIVTSPPYGGTYDYVEHHARRYPWLGLDARHLQHDELGARRALTSVGREEASQIWDDEVRAMLKAMRRVTRPGSRLVLLVGDGQVGGGPRARRIDAAQQLRRLASQHRLEVLCSASQERADWTEGGHKRARREHLVMLTPVKRS